jgi:DNA (cytosine-5)-methyltransferase 1
MGGVMNELALFAGAGGGILGGHLLGWRTVCAVEWDSYAASVLVARQNDGCLPPFPVWDDVQTFDGRGWRGRVDVVSGGFPCQDISAAGKGAGIDGKRSGMWGHMARIVREVEPRFVFVENSPMLTSRGLGRVLGDLAAMGYDASWGVLGAVDAGAPHKRERIWIIAHASCVDWHEWRTESTGLIGAAGLADGGDELAYSQRLQTDGERGSDQCGRDRVGRSEQASLKENGETGADGFVGQGEELADASRFQQGRQEQRAERQRAGAGSESIDVASADDGRLSERETNIRSVVVSAERKESCDSSTALAHPHRARFEEQRRRLADGAEHQTAQCGDWWQSEPDVGRVAHGVAHRVDRLKCLGNGQVSAVVPLAWEGLMKIIAKMEGRK